MRTFMKKSSLCLLLAVLVLLTGILVGTAITASAEEEPEFEATLYKADGKTVQKEGTLVECIQAGYGLSNTYNYKLVLHKDAEITEANLIIKPIAEFDGQGHTVYIDDAANVSATNLFFNITHAGTTVFKNINFVGQDMDWDGTVETMKTFGGSNGNYGAIYVPQTAHFEMQNCTMTAFRTNHRAACIYFVQSQQTEYNADYGVYLKDTKIVGNYALGSSASSVFIPNSGAGYWGDKLHISGNTHIKDNYNASGDPSANVYLMYTNGTCIESSLMVVEEDFTGLVGMSAPGGMNRTDVRRGCVFFVGDSYDATGKYTRQGAIFVGAGAAGNIWSSPQGATTNTFMHMVPEDETTPWGCYLISAGISANYSVLTDTVKMTVLDATGEKELFSYETAIQNGAILALPTWATWTDAKWGTASKTHANGTDYVGKVAYDTGFLYSTTAAGTSWTYSADFTPANTYKVIEALGDYELTATPSTGYNSTLIIDFNGYTLTRADKTYNLKWEGTSDGGAKQNVTIRNMVFDGTIDGAVPTDANTLIRGYKHATMTLENCEFKNIITTDAANDTYASYAAVIMANATSSITLKDVTATNCKGRQGVIYAGAIPVYIAGNTRLGEIVDGAFVSGTAMGLYSIGTSLAVTETFTGEVYCSLEGYSIANQPVYFKSSAVTPTDEMKAKAFVAEGAEIKGRIAPAANPTGYFAYNNQGTLSWTMPGNALPTEVSYDEEANTLSGSVWYYNDGTKNVPTTVIVADQFNYTFEENVAIDAEAVNSTTLAYGDLATVVGAAAAGQTVEVLKDVTGVNNLTVSKAITLDGNGKTLTWRTSPDPVAETDTAAAMIKVPTSGVVLKNIVFHGGAAEKGVWDGPLAPIGARMLVHTAPLTIENCVFTGARIEYAESRDDGAILGYSSSVLNLIDVTITDNIIKIANSAAYNAGPHLMRQGSDVDPTSLSGKMVIAENYRIMSDGKVYQDNFNINNPKRVTVGQLTEGSEIHTFWAGSYTPLLNEEGKPFNNSGYFYSDNASTSMTAKTQEDGSIAISGSSTWQSNLVYTGTQINQAADADVKFGDTVDTRGGITSDKFELYYMPVVTADYYGTDVVVKINGKEVARKNLSEYAVDASAITVEVAVGMAELTDDITLELQDMDGKVLASYTQTAKAYLSALLAGDYANTMKAAVASLLQYGAKVQIFFKHNLDDLAMTPDEESAWIAAGYIEEIGEGLKGGDSVKAFGSGEVTGVQIFGATLTMENQMSLRLYFTADSLDGLTFTVDGETVEVQEGAGMYYIEASHIGTALLASPVEFEIASATETLTYTASPMSYVFAVFATENSQITQELKDACEALYYYFVAAGECFGFNTNIGFAAALQVSVDPVNAYSIPYGITAA